MGKYDGTIHGDFNFIDYTRNGVKSPKSLFLFFEKFRIFQKIKTNHPFPVAAWAISQSAKIGILPRFMYKLLGHE